MTTDERREGMRGRFDSKIHGFHGNNSEVQVCDDEFLFKRDEMFKFIEAEVSRAASEERERIVKIVMESTPSHISRDYRDTDQMRDKIINLITQDHGTQGTKG